MSYEKQTWANGDIITAEKLNHIEDGVYNNSQSGGAMNTVELIMLFDASVTNPPENCIWKPGGALIFGNNIPVAIDSYGEYFNLHPLTFSDSIQFPVGTVLWLSPEQFFAEGSNGVLMVNEVSATGDIELEYNDYDDLKGIRITGNGTLSITWQFTD